MIDKIMEEKEYVVHIACPPPPIKITAHWNRAVRPYVQLSLYDQ